METPAWVLPEITVDWRRWTEIMHSLMITVTLLGTQSPKDNFYIILYYYPEATGEGSLGIANKLFFPCTTGTVTPPFCLNSYNSYPFEMSNFIAIWLVNFPLVLNQGTNKILESSFVMLKKKDGG